MDDVIDNKHQFYCSNGLENQAYILVCGPLFAFEITYVVINKIKISCGKCIIDAIDTCFKAFFAFNLEYNCIASHNWTFFHWYIYKLDRNKKKTIGLSKCTDLMNDLKEIE